MASEVFISYQNEDRNAANRLCEALEKKSLSCWIAPRNIPPGRDWPEAIVEGATHCRALVVVLSSRSVSSRQVGRELETADKAGARIITFRIENVQPPPAIAYFLGGVQWVDAFDGRFERAVEQLANAVNAVECSPAPAPMATRPVAFRPETAAAAPGLQTGRKLPNYALIGGATALVVAAVIGGTMIARSHSAADQAARTALRSAPANSHAGAAAGGDAEQSWKKGKELVDENNAIRALPYLSRSIELDPSKANPYVYRAIAESSLNKPERALEDASKAIEINPSWAYAYLVRARIYMRAGKNILAIPDFTYVVEHGAPVNARAAQKELNQARRKSGPQ